MRLPRYKISLAIIDAITLTVSVLISTIIVFGTNIKSVNLPLWEIVSILFLFFILLFIYLFLQQTNNLYKLNVFITIIQQIVSLLRSVIYFTFICIGIAFFLKITLVLDSRFFVVIFGLNLFFLQLIFRVFIARTYYLKNSRKTTFKRKVIIIGGGSAGKILASKLFIEESFAIKIIGFVDDNLPINSLVLDNIKNLGRIEDLVKLKNETKFDELILAINNLSYERLISIIDICKENNFALRISSDLVNIVSENLSVERYANFPAIDSTPRINISFSLFIKRITDVVLSFLFILIFSPVYLFIAIAIKLTSKGPILYKQTRIGKDGKPFTFYKFRSMTVIDGEDKEREQMMIDFMKNGKTQSSSSAKIINGSRVTKIGKMIRKTSLDEIPQFFNVLKGDMSIVGPRPCLPYEYENFEPWQKRRLDVIPGITGVWQVFGRNKVSFKDSVILDLYYVNNMSPWFDFYLILKTVPVLLNLRGGV